MQLHAFDQIIGYVAVGEQEDGIVKPVGVQLEDKRLAERSVGEPDFIERPNGTTPYLMSIVSVTDQAVGQSKIIGHKRSAFAPTAILIYYYGRRMVFFGCIRA